MTRHRTATDKRLHDALVTFATKLSVVEPGAVGRSMLMTRRFICAVCCNDVASWRHCIRNEVSRCRSVSDCALNEVVGNVSGGSAALSASVDACDLVMASSSLSILIARCKTATSSPLTSTVITTRCTAVTDCCIDHRNIIAFLHCRLFQFKYLFTKSFTFTLNAF